jgi:hypothetical protein
MYMESKRRLERFLDAPEAKKTTQSAKAYPGSAKTEAFNDESPDFFGKL